MSFLKSLMPADMQAKFDALVLDMHVLPVCIHCGAGTTRNELFRLIEDGATQADIQELFISGTHPKCWDDMFADGDETDFFGEEEPERVIVNVGTVYDGMSDEDREAMESDPCFQCLGMGRMCIADPNYEGEVGTCLAGRC